MSKAPESPLHPYQIEDQQERKRTRSLEAGRQVSEAPKRYSIDHQIDDDNATVGAWMKEDGDGEYALYADLEAANKRVAELEAERNGYARGIICYCSAEQMLAIQLTVNHDRAALATLDSGQGGG